MNIKALKDSEIMLLHKDDLQKIVSERSILAGIRQRKMTEVIYLSAQKNSKNFCTMFRKEGTIIYYQKTLRFSVNPAGNILQAIGG